jgi:hypothetical protein
LYTASNQGKDGVVTLLLAHPGIIVNQANKDGITQLFCALFLCTIEIMAYLMTKVEYGVLKKEMEKILSKQDRLIAVPKSENLRLLKACVSKEVCLYCFVLP